MIDKARFLIKSFDNVQYAKKFLMEGEMYFNCPAYFRYLAKRGELAKLNNNGEVIKNQFKGIGDFNEASIAWTIRVYQNIPIYCMYTVGNNDVKGNNVLLRKKAFDEFKSNNHKYFVVCEKEQFFNRIYSVFAGDGVFMFVSYEGVNPQSEEFYVSHMREALFRKSLSYAHQQEFRIALANDRINSKITYSNQSCEILLSDGQPYRGILRRVGDISAFSKIISYEVLNCFDEKYYSFNIK
ncbi:MAG TPA: hypothetical protein DHU65_01060 [Clostridiales bacterium]|nr:hypothetical protein [Clostridiales bacterium]